MIMTSLSCISLQTMAPAEIPSANVLCLGTFDGVHLAHRALLQKAKQVRDRLFTNAACTVFCFAESPADFFSKSPPAQIYTTEQRLEAFREEGMDFAIVADFSAFRMLSPSDFVTEILQRTFHCVAAVCGFNYHFGNGGSGTADTLASLLPVPVYSLPKITQNGLVVSSTRIRHFLQEGEVEQAARFLTKPFSFSAPVLHGKALGRTWGFPTMNQFLPKHSVSPKSGVYLTRCTLPNDCDVYGISNLGTHPTVDRNAPLNCETYLLNFSGDLYGETVTVAFLKRLRDESKFESVEQLKQQIQTDIATAEEMISQAGSITADENRRQP